VFVYVCVFILIHIFCSHDSVSSLAAVFFIALFCPMRNEATVCLRVCGLLRSLSNIPSGDILSRSVCVYFCVVMCFLSDAFLAVVLLCSRYSLSPSLRYHARLVQLYLSVLTFQFAVFWYVSTQLLFFSCVLIK
jgi:hypothetical protein